MIPSSLGLRPSPNTLFAAWLAARSHPLVVVLEQFDRLLLEDPRRFETDRIVAAIRGMLSALGPV